MKRGNVLQRLLLLVVAAVAVAPAALHTQEAMRPKSDFTVVAATSDEGSDETFASLITSFIVNGLESEDLTSRSLEIGETEISIADSIPDLINGLPLESEGFLVAVIFSRTSENVIFDYYCIDLTDANVVFVEKRVRAKLLLIDVELTRLTTALLDTLGESLVRSTPEPEQNENEASDGQRVESREESILIEDAPPLGNPRAEVDVWSLRPQQSRVHFALGGGSFRTIAHAEDFFRSAAFSTATIEYGLGTRFGRIGMGTRIAAGFFAVDGEEIDANGILAPFAANFGYTSATKSAVDFIFTIGGGGSLLLLRIGDEAYRAKLVPFGSAGIGSLLKLTESIGIRVFVEALFFFEAQHPIIGYAPSVSLVF